MDLTGLIEEFQFNGSLKDIPIPSRLQYKMDLIMKCKDLINRIRWKVFFKTKNENVSLQNVNKKMNGNVNMDYKNIFKSRKIPPTSMLLNEFEDSIWNLVRNIEFVKYPNRKNAYLRNLAMKINQIRNDHKILIFSDKTKNIYKISPAIYDTLLMRELCKKYKIVQKSFLLQVNLKIKKVMERLDIADRTEPIIPKEPRISIKDHKLNFIANATVRLICPNSSDIGKVSKRILDKYIVKFRNFTKLSLWVNTIEALDWFKAINNKNNWRFLQVDIVDYYSSINEIVLNKALIVCKE